MTILAFFKVNHICFITFLNVRQTINRRVQKNVFLIKKKQQQSIFFKEMPFFEWNFCSNPHLKKDRRYSYKWKRVTDGRGFQMTLNDLKISVYPVRQWLSTYFQLLPPHINLIDCKCMRLYLKDDTFSSPGRITIGYSIISKLVQVK